MKKEMIAVATMMAGKVVSASIDTDIQESLVDETLNEWVIIHGEISIFNLWRITV